MAPLIKGLLTSLFQAPSVGRNEKKYPNLEEVKKMKKAVLILLVALALLFTAVPMAAAPATKTPFTAQATLIPTSPGKIWITSDGVQQVKGAIAEGTVTGDLTGSLAIIQGATLDLNTGEGFMHGKFTITTAEGTFQGSFTGVITGYFYTSGQAVGHGTGAYEAQKIMGAFNGYQTMIDDVPTTILALEGLILSPHG